ncbi:hypothetical protein LUW75_02190 [Streptomyces sp. MRC013]|uniref:hypothetical protein n=1 Tax=Streptomyces sp. MRC013 TaxID=2898276 RepID=UPI002026508E|nr:hypothetical protein [Streptomyces sp. MRC013]URM89025.1 hypothetical protein LUW75_02190 [Streptomyces sp. MRC013]
MLRTMLTLLVPMNRSSTLAPRTSDAASIRSSPTGSPRRSTMLARESASVTVTGSPENRAHSRSSTGVAALISRESGSRSFSTGSATPSTSMPSECDRSQEARISARTPSRGRPLPGPALADVGEESTPPG